MPRKPSTQSKFIVTTIHDSSDDSIGPQDALLHEKLKILGRGNRANLAGIGQLISALQVSRKGRKRVNSAYLSAADLKNKVVIEALDNLGVLARPLTKLELIAVKSGTPLSPSTIAALNKVAEHFMEKAVKHL